MPPEHALVISSEHTNSDGSHKAAEEAKNVAWPPPADSPAHLMKPSFLTMEFSAQPRLAKQKVDAVAITSQQQHPCPYLLLPCTLCILDQASIQTFGYHMAGSRGL